MSSMTAWVTRPPRVADDGSVSEPEPEDDRGVDPVVEAGHDEHLPGGYAECGGGVGAGELLVALEQGGILVMAGSLPFPVRGAVAGGGPGGPPPRGGPRARSSPPR